MSKKLVIEFIPFGEIENLKSDDRIEKVLSIARDDKIIILEGRFSKQEEAKLIQRTMESIDRKFKGIEIAVINPSPANVGFFGKIRCLLANVLLGDRDGLTLVGPATVINEIKQDPTRLNQLSIDLNK